MQKDPTKLLITSTIYSSLGGAIGYLAGGMIGCSTRNPQELAEYAAFGGVASGLIYASTVAKTKKLEEVISSHVERLSAERRCNEKRSCFKV